MNHLINQLMTVDKAFHRHYPEMLLTLNRSHALTPWQMSMLLWRAKIFHIQVLYPELGKTAVIPFIRFSPLSLREIPASVAANIPHHSLSWI